MIPVGLEWSGRLRLVHGSSEVMDGGVGISLEWSGKVVVGLEQCW